MRGFRRGLCLLMLMVMSAAAADAVMFECKRPDGTIIFTDDPLKVPDDCQRKPIESLSPALLAPASPQPQPQQPPQATLPAGAKSAAGQAENGQEPSLETLQSEAALLVMRYQDARQRYNRASFAKDQLAAMREMAEVKAQKNALLKAVDQSSLSSIEKQAIMTTLTAIAE